MSQTTTFKYGMLYTCLSQMLLSLQVRGAEKIADLTGHVIVCGAEESFHNFIEQLRRCDPQRPPVVILHPRLPKFFAALQQMFQPLHYVQVALLMHTLSPTMVKSTKVHAAACSL